MADDIIVGIENAVRARVVPQGGGPRCAVKLKPRRHAVCLVSLPRAGPADAGNQRDRRVALAER